MTFDSRQPPDSASDDLRDNVDKPLEDACNDLTDLRVALRAGDKEQLRKSFTDLADVSQKLDDLQERL